MKGLMRVLAKRAVIVPLIVLAVLTLGVLVARAGTPTITDLTTPPAGHFSGACEGCHAVVHADPAVPGEGVDGIDDETGTIEVDGANNDTESVGADGDHQNGHNDTETVDAGDGPHGHDDIGTVDAQGDQGDQSGDQGGHETVVPGMHDRGDQSGDQGDSAGDQQGDQGDQGDPAPAPRVARTTHHSGSSHSNAGTGGSGGQNDGSGN